MTGRTRSEPRGRRGTRLPRGRWFLSVVGMLLMVGAARAHPLPVAPPLLGAAGELAIEPDMSKDCVVAAGKALGAALLWGGCIASVAGSAGATLVPCIALGIGTYFLALAAAQECLSECPTCGGGDDGEEELPSCDDPELEVGDLCLCTCPGEPCCDWP